MRQLLSNSLGKIHPMYISVCIIKNSTEIADSQVTWYHFVAWAFVINYLEKTCVLLSYMLYILDMEMPITDVV